jgi:uncharacterized membrane protein (DUF485 family)
MLHQPAASSGHDPAISYKMRLGVVMFLLYAVVYAAFVAINLIWPQAMAAIGLGGMNLAVVYGFALIILAIIQAIIYNELCLREERRLASRKPVVS